MNEHCPTTQVTLQENGIIRDQEGTIIGRLIEDTDEFAEKHYQRGITDAINRVRRAYYQENDKETIEMTPREVALHVGMKSGLTKALNVIRE